METPLWKRVAAAATTAMLTLSLVPAPAIAQTAAAGEAEMGVEGQAPAKQAPAEELAPVQEPVATVEPVEAVAAQSDELATEAAPAAEEGEPGLEAQATPRYEQEVNDTKEQANSVALNTYIRGSKSKDKDEDWFAIKVQTQGACTLSFNNEAFGAYFSDYVVELLDSRGNTLFSSNWNYGDRQRSSSFICKSWNVTIPAGTYYARVVTPSGAPNGTEYRISLCRQGTQPADDSPLSRFRRIADQEAEPNDGRPTANLASTNKYIYGSARDSSSSDHADLDWFAFQIPTRGKYKFSFNNETYGYNSWYIGLYDYAGNLIDYCYVNAREQEEAVWEAYIPAGTAYISVTSNSINTVELSGDDWRVPAGTQYRLSLKLIQEEPYRKTFPDVPKGFWGYDVVHRAASIGIVNGYNDGNFGPDDKVTRGQAAVMLYNLSGRRGSITGTRRFPDVQDRAYYFMAVCWASAQGVINGYKNGNFGPDDPITREQLATMLANYASNYAKKNVSGSASDYASMRDAGSVSGYARKSVGWCFRNKILSGTKDGRVNPKGNATRAETAKMMLGLYNQLD